MSFQTNPLLLTDASMAFFPIIYGAKDRHIIPNKAREESFAGIALLEQRVPHRILVTAAEGKTLIKKKALVFSVFSIDEDQSPKNIFGYWEKIKELQNRFVVWNIVPQAVYNFLKNECFEGKNDIYYHDPLLQKEQHLFAVTVNGRIRTYRVEDPFTERKN
ncbi:MAG: hypothetical protein KBB91_00050 [Candidatus Pacebacteria bacterium]|jgi:hypothetical protein|nr:hypothetical protein [Candidatus Paceibacterota bacterium]MBP9700786.1 hypothetical protein [Candidatus Paceibacterota bacterium]